MKTQPSLRRPGASLGIALGLTLASACATTTSPPELVKARAAYIEAQSGSAGQLAPAELRLAKASLDDAELAVGGGRDDLARDRGYIALRRAQIARTQGEIRQESQRREAAIRQLATAKGIQFAEAEALLGAAHRDLAQSQQQSQDATARLQAEQQRATATAQQLEAERQARIQAEAKAKQALDELGRLASVKEETRGVVITLSGAVLFASNQATLLPAATRALDSVVTALQATPDRNAIIEGHTDSQGSRPHNLDLGRRRAEAVRDYLVSRGVQRERLTAAGIGPDRAVADNRSAEGRANNRRVEIVIAPLAPNAAAAAAPAAPLGTTPR
jgi:outer membrane protein OmpA-like peptidoglycan-associated protein